MVSVVVANGLLVTINDEENLKLSTNTMVSSNMFVIFDYDILPFAQFKHFDEAVPVLG